MGIGIFPRGVGIYPLVVADFVVILPAESKIDGRRVSQIRDGHQPMADKPYFYWRVLRTNLPAEIITSSITSSKAHKTEKNMKTTVKSMMLIGMMVLGSVTTFGKTTISVSLNGPHISAHVTTKAKECKLRHMHDKNCGGMVVEPHKAPGRCPLSDKEMEKHMKKGKHNFLKNDICKKCHLTREQVRQMERCDKGGCKKQDRCDKKVDCKKKDRCPVAQPKPQPRTWRDK